MANELHYFGLLLAMKKFQSKGQINIHKHIRQQLGIRKGSKLEATILGNHIELYIDNIPTTIKSTGFAMLQSNRPDVPTDFDPASLLNDDGA